MMKLKEEYVEANIDQIPRSDLKDFRNKVLRARDT